MCFPACGPGFVQQIFFLTLVNFGIMGDNRFNERIPGWDGDPRNFKTFEREVMWWKAGEVESRLSFNVAARFVVCQKGPVRTRAELFSPADPQATPPVVAEDAVAVQVSHPLAGIIALLTCYLVAYVGACCIGAAERLRYYH